MSDPFQELLDALADRTISDEQFSQLEQLIVEDSELRKRFLDYQNLCGSLEERALSAGESRRALNLQAAVESENINEHSPSDKRVSLSHRGDRQRQTKWRRVQIAAAVLLAGLIIGAPLGWKLNQRATVEVPPDTGASEDFIATLVSVSEDAVWGDVHDSARLPGEGIDNGLMRLDAGSIELKFACGATVRVEGPAAFGVVSPMRCYLEFGQAKVHAPESARNFIVATGSMEVVDLGTRFEIDVDQDSGTSNVTVTEGLVDLHLGSRGTQRRIEPLEAGWKAEVNASGEILKLEEQPRERLVVKPGIDSHLLAHWKFDEVGRDGIVTDSWKRQVDGVFKEGKGGETLSGIIDGALNFDDTGRVDLSEHISLFNRLEAFTISAWVRDPMKDGGDIFSLSDETAKDQVYFKLKANAVVYKWQNPPSRIDRVEAVVDGWEPGRWYHVAVVYRDNIAWLYRDGEMIGSSSVGVKLGTQVPSFSDVQKPTHAYLGYHKWRSRARKPDGFQSGVVMDDVQFYTIGLSRRAIGYLYKNPGERWSPEDPTAQYRRTEFIDPDTTRLTLDGTPNTVWRLTQDKTVRDYINYHNTQCWSHDGRYVCIERWIYGPASANWTGKAGIQIYIMDLETNTEIYIDTGMAPRWAKLSNKLFYVHWTQNGDFTWETGIENKMYDCDLATHSVVAYGMQELGETSKDDVYLYGIQRYGNSYAEYRPVEGLERVAVRALIDPVNPSTPVQLGDGTGVRPLPNRQHDVITMRNKIGNEQDTPFGRSRSWSDLDGSNIRTATILTQAGHQTWSGDGAYWILGNMQLTGRKWNENYPSNIYLLANDRTSDPGECGHSGRWMTGGNTILDTRTGGSWQFTTPKSKIVYTSGTGDVSEPYDADCKGSPDGTKVCYVSNADLERTESTYSTSNVGNSNIIDVLSTAAFPNSGDLRNKSEIIGYTSKTATTFEGLTRGKYQTKEYGIDFGDGIDLLDIRIITDADRDPENSPRYMGDEYFGVGTGDLRHQHQTDAYVVIVREPDAPYLRENDGGQMQLVPGENHRETAGYRIFLDGYPVVSGGALLQPGSTFTLSVPGSYTARAVEKGGVVGKESNALVTTVSRTIEVLDEIPGDFSWLVDYWLVGNSFVTEAQAIASAVSAKIRIHLSEGLLSNETWNYANLIQRETTDYFGVVTMKEYYNNDSGVDKLYLKEFYKDPSKVIDVDTGDTKVGIVSEEIFDVDTGYKLSSKQWRYDDNGFHSDMKKRAKLSHEWFYENAVPMIYIRSGERKYVNVADENGDSQWVEYRWGGSSAYDHYNPTDEWVLY
jgi:hypothetical protein